ncbi:MAG: DUF4340 domain-containing protein [Clostridiales bacterium]|nr:DUF4340 domain-containing protein [Clostridiales bacterium]
MLDVSKKKKRASRHGRLWLLLCAAALVLAVGAGALLLNRPEEALPEHTHDASGTLASYEASQVVRVAITLRGGESWAAVQSSQGMLSLEDAPEEEISAGMSGTLLEAARSVTYQEVLSGDPQEYASRLDEFGLDDPRLVAEITYADGARWVMRIGNLLSLEENNAYYMTVDGDKRLFALDKGSAETLMVERARLHPVTQPILHKARFDRVTFADGQGNVLAEWALQGEIGGNAQDRWLLTAPVKYPADGEAIGNLHDNLENLRLGAYVGAATPENLTACGFDEPRFILMVHQAAGSIGTTGADGVYAVNDWPEDTFTLTIGGAKSDMVDYVRVGEHIYISSHFTLEVFMDMEPVSTLSRYTVPVALGNLKSLTIRQAGGESVYTVTRTEQVAENNQLVTDSAGNVAYDLTCDLNGTALPYVTFESAYNELLKVTVSGFLPEGWTAAEPPHTTYVFEAVTGERYTLELARFDAMHDAVLLDGNALFYLIRDGMTFDVK